MAACFKGSNLSMGEPDIEEPESVKKLRTTVKKEVLGTFTPSHPSHPSHSLSPPLTSFSPLFLSRNGEAAEVVVSNGRVLLPSAEGCVIQEQAFRAELLLRTRQRQSYGTRMESCHGCQRKTRELAKYRYAQFIIRGWETKREEKGIP